MKPAPLFILTLFLAALAGCHTVPAVLEDAGLERAEIYVPANYRAEARLPVEIQRVAVLPIHGGVFARPDSAAALDAVVLKAIQHQARFEVVFVSREECHRLFGHADLSSVSALPHGFLETIGRRYAVDAVLFTDLTAYAPYRPLSLGFRSKLATVDAVRLVWAFDEIFSGDDPRMRNSMRKFYGSGDRPNPSNSLPTALQSPVRFGAVAADLMFRTLPVR